MKLPQGAEAPQKPSKSTSVAKKVRHPPPDPKATKVTIIPVAPRDIRIQRAIEMLLILADRRRKRLSMESEAES